MPPPPLPMPLQLSDKENAPEPASTPRGPREREGREEGRRSREDDRRTREEERKAREEERWTREEEKKGREADRRGKEGRKDDPRKGRDDGRKSRDETSGRSTLIANRLSQGPSRHSCIVLYWNCSNKVHTIIKKKSGGYLVTSVLVRLPADGSTHAWLYSWDWDGLRNVAEGSDVGSSVWQRTIHVHPSLAAISQ